MTTYGEDLYGDGLYGDQLPGVAPPPPPNAITLNVFIAGVATACREVHTKHDVDQPIGTGSLVMSAPRPPHVQLAATVRVEAGYNGQVFTIFDGRIAEDDAAFSEQGRTFRAALEGWGKLLWYAQTVDQKIMGSVRLDKVFNTFTTARGVPSAFADATTNPDNTPINVGGQIMVDGGYFTVKRDTSPGEVIDRIGGHYGYRLFDTPDGTVRLQKVSGSPDGYYEVAFRNYHEALESFVSPANRGVFNVRKTRTLVGMANYIEVLGARYTGPDTAEVAVRSIPAVVPSDTRLGPSGVNRLSIRDDAFLFNSRADHARNVYEIDRSTPYQRVSWTGIGDPELSPGQVVTMVSPTVNGSTGTDLTSFLVGIAPIPLWLMQVAHSITDRGWTTSMEGWAGTGTALPAGNDCVTTTILGTAGRHVGNETLSHYRRPTPDGLTATIAFTVLDNYSTLTIYAKGHGCNSFVRNTASTSSRFEIWQTVSGVYKSVASGEMPRLNENLEQRYPYGPTDTYWQDMVIPLSGSLKSGAADLKIISGKDSDVGDNDDYEVSSVRLKTCGVGEPVVVL